MIDRAPPGEKPQILSTTQARQAQRTFGLRVLVISLALVIVMFIIAYTFSETTDSDDLAPAAPALEENERSTPPEIPPSVLEPAPAPIG